MHGASLLAPTQLWAPYSAVLRMWAELSSWAADLLLVGLKNLFVFSSELLALETKKH